MDVLTYSLSYSISEKLKLIWVKWIKKGPTQSQLKLISLSESGQRTLIKLWLNGRLMIIMVLLPNLPHRWRILYRLSTQSRTFSCTFLNYNLFIKFRLIGKLSLPLVCIIIFLLLRSFLTHKLSILFLIIIKSLLIY